MKLKQILVSTLAVASLAAFIPSAQAAFNNNDLRVGLDLGFAGQHLNTTKVTPELKTSIGSFNLNTDISYFLAKTRYFGVAFGLEVGGTRGTLTSNVNNYIITGNNKKLDYYNFRYGAELLTQLYTNTFYLPYVKLAGGGLNVYVAKDTSDNPELTDFKGFYGSVGLGLALHNGVYFEVNGKLGQVKFTPVKGDKQTYNFNSIGANLGISF